MPINNPTPAVRPPSARDELDYASAPGGYAPDGAANFTENIALSPAPTPTPANTAIGAGIDLEPVSEGAGFLPSAPAPVGTDPSAPIVPPPVAPPSAGGGVGGGGVGGSSSPAAGLVPPEYQLPAGTTGKDSSSVVGGLTGLANQTLGNVSRWDIPLVRQATQLIDRELADQRNNAEAGIAEFNSSRGRTGSTFEAQEMGQLQEGLEMQRMSRLHDLNLNLAETSAEDRRAAADITTQAGMFERLLGQDKVQASQWQSEFEHGATMDIAQLRQRESEFGRNFELQKAELGQRESQFARSLGLETARFTADQNQFAATHAERIATRLQEGNQFAQSLGLEESKLALERSIQTRALDLQEQGMAQDEAFRQAELSLERDIQNRALALEEQGMGLDEAYRYAALEQSNELAERDLGLKERAIDDTSRLSQLDILLRALSSGMDPAELGLDEDAIMALFS